MSKPDRRTKRALAERDARAAAPRGDVMVAWVHGDMVDHSWFLSLMGNILGSDRIGPFCAMRYGADGLVAARNDVAEAFLRSPAQWLWWVDTDMGFSADTVDRLLASADPSECPVLGALCFASKETHSDGFGGYRTTAVPTMYGFAADGDGRTGFAPVYDYPRDQVVQVAGTGSACILIHRSVMQAVADKFGPGQWYQRTPNPSTGQLLGEDLSFCVRVAACGIPVHVDSSIKTTHRKPMWLQESDYHHPSDA